MIKLIRIMWLRLLYVYLFASILGLVVSQDGNTTDAGSSPAPGSSAAPGPEPPGGNGSAMCMGPMDMFKEHPDETMKVIDWINMMRDKRDSINPGAAGICTGGKLEKDEALQHSAMMSGMMCPIPDGGMAMMPSFMNKGDHGETVVFGQGNMLDGLMDEMVWKKGTADMPEEEFKHLMASYKPDMKYDALIQMMWMETMKVGCAWMVYNDTDAAHVAKIFGKSMDVPCQITMLVCHWSPVGCVEGQEVSKYCGIHVTTEGSEGPSGDTSPDTEPTTGPDGSSTPQPVTAKASRQIDAQIGIQALAVFSTLILLNTP